LYSPAAQAMLADLVGPGQRPRAYGLWRMASNLGFAIGPALGGFIAEQSYLTLFLLNAATGLTFAAVVLFGTDETKPDIAPQGQPRPGLLGGGFGRVVANRPFVAFCVVSVAIGVVYSQMSTALPVYMKEGLGLAESHYGWVMTTNAGMVALLQYGVTRRAERRPRLRMMALGLSLYAVGVGSVSLAQGFAWFVASMAILTLGEMIAMPIANAVAADLAPPDLRGRYMSLLGITWSAGMGLGPWMGGALADNLGLSLLWPTMAGVGFAAAGAYLLLERAVGPRLAGAEPTG
ncbi:MAG: MFS transporter, partial [Chloroflexi bacterium]|nr:MFS transporter [Chloroflexota bacterium]